jgi:uncharacterized Tic20 family protein
MTTTTEVSSDQRTLAMLAHLLGIFTGVIGALVIWLMKKDEGGFVENQAKEALNFQITLLIASVIGMVLTLVLIGFLVLLAVAVASIAFSIMGAVKAYRGERYRYPVTLRLVS